MTIPKTSRSHPLRIDAVTPGGGHGRIGITLCPGKTDPAGLTGAWARNLNLDLDAVADRGATAVVSLITDQELDHLAVRDLPGAVRDRRMEWWHLPIPDGAPPGPDFEKSWKVAGEALRDRLRAGFDILVHCKGGLGRAGTVAARLLVELGANPDDAIRRVREAREPQAIETNAQEAHVAACGPRTPAVSPQTADSIRDRALGAFLGLAVGDAVGTTLEFCLRDAQPRLEDMVGGGPFDLPPGTWTDDTSMALALADSLAATGRDAVDCRDLMDRFVRWWQQGAYSPVGRCPARGEPGGRCRYGSGGNGAARRRHSWPERHSGTLARAGRLAGPTGRGRATAAASIAARARANRATPRLSGDADP